MGVYEIPLPLFRRTWTWSPTLRMRLCVGSCPHAATARGPGSGVKGPRLAVDILASPVLLGSTLQVTSDKCKWAPGSSSSTGGGREAPANDGTGHIGIRYMDGGCHVDMFRAGLGLCQPIPDISTFCRLSMFAFSQCDSGRQLSHSALLGIEHPQGHVRSEAICFCHLMLCDSVASFPSTVGHIRLSSEGQQRPLVTPTR